MALAPPSNSVVQDTKPAGSKSATADDILDTFKELDKEPEVPEKPTKAKEDKEEPEKEVKSSESDEELELVEPDEDIEKLDLEKPDEEFEIEAPPRKKEILKEYPELFKKFPFLEKMLYRDRQYNELFGSFDDAKEAAEQASNFQEFEKQLLSGDTEQILREVKETDQRAFNIILDEYLPTLARIDRQAYLHVTGNLNRRLIMEMMQEAKDSENEDLKQAALILNQFIFGSAKFTAPANLVDRSKEADEKNSEAEQERLAEAKGRFEEVREDLQTQVDNTLRATISEYIDPRNTMSAYVKKNAVNDALKYLGELIAQDGSVVKNLNRLWKAAYENRYSRDYTGKIKSYYLSKAKANLKSAIMRARAEALKDSRPPKDKNETDEDSELRDQEPRQSPRRITGRPSQPKGNNEMKKGESVTDFFMRD